MNKPPKRLLDQVREQIRLKHYSIRTEQAYWDWVKRSKPESFMKIEQISGETLKWEWGSPIISKSRSIIVLFRKSIAGSGGG